MFELDYLPIRWSEGFIVPIRKRDAKIKATNYQGITVLSTLRKVFKRVLNKRLNSWAETYGVFVEAQADFRKNVSTIDNTFVLKVLFYIF